MKKFDKHFRMRNSDVIEYVNERIDFFVWVVGMIFCQETDRLAIDAAADILDCHLGSHDGTRSRDMRIDGLHIDQQYDPDFVIGKVGERRGRNAERKQQAQAAQPTMKKLKIHLKPHADHRFFCRKH